MDPISVAASVLTLLGAAGKAGQALEHVSNLRHAPDQLVALINEVRVFESLPQWYQRSIYLDDKVADLRVVLSSAREVVQGRIEASQDCGSLAHIVERAGHTIAELNHFIHCHLVGNVAAHSLGSKPKVSRAAFLWHNGKIRSLKVDLQEIKLNLLVAVGTLTLWVYLMP